MSNIDELHQRYIEAKNEDIEDYNYGVEDNYEAQKINEYCSTDGELVELHWQPIAKDNELEKQILKLKAMKDFNKGR